MTALTLDDERLEALIRRVVGEELDKRLFSEPAYRQGIGGLLPPPPVEPGQRVLPIALAAHGIIGRVISAEHVVPRSQGGQDGPLLRKTGGKSESDESDRP